ncbi:hypothetical protein PR048_027244 [Dryococelus australis]|uniref:Uncharacterized protein n=1 Tax=Dryococelus australis TaxID=614101 RepID=A0ABQ9GG94_9NEOP|nr:hypothetical protein PR048_027244 [Dryococelus australis]
MPFQQTTDELSDRCVCQKIPPEECSSFCLAGTFQPSSLSRWNVGTFSVCVLCVTLSYWLSVWNDPAPSLPPAPSPPTPYQSVVLPTPLTPHVLLFPSQGECLFLWSRRFLLSHYISQPWYTSEQPDTPGFHDSSAHNFESASSGTIPTCENPELNRPGIEPGSPWWEVSVLIAQPINSTKYLVDSLYFLAQHRDFVYSNTYLFRRTKCTRLANQNEVTPVVIGEQIPCNPSNQESGYEEHSEPAFAILSPHATYHAQTGVIFTLRNVDGGVDPGLQGWRSSVQQRLGQGLPGRSWEQRWP